MSSNLSSNASGSSRSQEKVALSIALVLTGLFAIIEFIGGWLTNSLALIADAGHMVTDVAALGLSLFAVWFSSRPATAKMTYGFLRVEILAALLNGVGLVVISLLIFLEAYYRLFKPPEVRGAAMLAIASVGLVVNFACALILHRSHLSNLNVRGAFLHVVGDALGSVGAMVAGFLIVLKEWYLADPLISLVVGLMILYSSWRLVRDSVDILLEGTPTHVNVEALRRALCDVDGVESVHDLHIWTLSSGIHAMSCHVVLCGSDDRHKILEQLNCIVRSRFRINHSTIQLEEISLKHQEMTSCH